MTEINPAREQAFEDWRLNVILGPVADSSAVAHEAFCAGWEAAREAIFGVPADSADANGDRPVSPDGEDAPAGRIAPEPALPEGIFARVELPGYRKHTGWVTEDTRFGAQVAVVRDWDGGVIAEVVPGPGCQIVHLPTPRKRPEPPLALEAGPRCTCGGLSGGEDIDERPDCPVHGDPWASEDADYHGVREPY